MIFTKLLLCLRKDVKGEKIHKKIQNKRKLVEFLDCQIRRISVNKKNIKSIYLILVKMVRICISKLNFAAFVVTRITAFIRTEIRTNGRT